MDDIYNQYSFPEPLDLKKCQNFAKFIGERIGGDTNIGILESNEPWPIAMVFKKYKEGMAYGQMAFVRGDKNKEKPYVGIALTTKTPFKKMENLAKKLHVDVQDSYKEFFEENNIY